MQDILADTSTWAFVLGLLVPFAQSVVQRPTWSKTQRVLVAVGFALAVALVTVLANGEFDTTNWLATAGVVLATAQTSYALLYKPTGVAKVVELRTSPQHSVDAYRDAA